MHDLTKICLMTCVVAGCAAGPRYSGPRRAPHEIAVLQVPGEPVTDGQHQARVWLTALDGQWRGLGNLSRHEFLPGLHTVTVAHMGLGDGSHGETVLEFEAAAGGVYALEAAFIPNPASWAVRIRDLKTDALISKTVAGADSGG